jgi:preprotein translocase subunit SecE
VTGGSIPPAPATCYLIDAQSIYIGKRGWTQKRQYLVIAMANKFVNFLNEVKLEMGKVSWSTRDELIGSTIVVLVSLAILSIFIGICDVVLSTVVNVIMSRV